MRIIVISDTHANGESELPTSLLDAIKSADYVIHAGDFESQKLYDDLALRNKNFHAVKGNNDHFLLPKHLTLEIEGIRIAVIHSDGAKGDRINYLIYTFEHFSPNIIIFGHTHVPLVKKINDITFMNPGSTKNNRGMLYNSYGVIDIKENSYTASIAKLQCKIF